MNRFVTSLLVIVVANIVVSSPNFLETRHISRIINGRNAPRGEFPFQVHLAIEKGDFRQRCGGIFICEGYVLTAAHCMRGQTKVTITLGTITPYEPRDAWTEVRSASRATIHPNYNWTTMANDIAIIKLNETVRTNDYIKSIYISGVETRANSPVAALGWGRTSKYGEYSPTLLYAYLTTITNDECKKTYHHYVNEDSLCTKPLNSQNVCVGDSGGALVMGGGGNYYLVGSMVASNCDDKPSFHTRIDHYKEWIKSEVNDICHI